MSSTTTNLGLVKMASGETIGQWSDANNGSGGNLDKIDTAVGNLNSHIGTDNSRVGTDVQTYLNSLAVGHYNVCFAYNATGLPTNATTDLHIFIWDATNHNGVVSAVNAAGGNYTGILLNGVLTWTGITTISRAAATTHNFTFPNQSANLIAVDGQGGSRQYMAYVYNSTDSLTIFELAKGSGITVANSGSTIGVTFNQSMGCTAKVINISGSGAIQ